MKKNKSKRLFYSVGWSESTYRYVDVIRFAIGADNLDEHMIKKLGFSISDFQAHMRCTITKDAELFKRMLKAKILERRQSIEAPDPDTALLIVCNVDVKGIKVTNATYYRPYQEGDVVVEVLEQGKFDVYTRKGVMCVNVWEGLTLEGL
jgi:hypothetical protein